MALQGLLRRGTFRTYILVLCVLYFMMVLLFHSDLQDSRQNVARPPPSPRRLPNTATPNLTPYRTNKESLRARVIVDTSNNLHGPEGVEAIPESHNPVPSLRHVQVRHSQSGSSDCVGVDSGKEYEFLEAVPKTLYVYSAFWDHRPNDFDNRENGSYIRIMSGLLWFGQRPAVECVFTDDGGQETRVAVSYYEMCENHGRPIGGFILSCRVPPHIQKMPCSVGVREVKDGSQQINLKVLSIDPKPIQDKFAVCVSPIFGNIEPNKLVEFIELTQLLGAQRITFYDFQVSADVASVLEYYQDRKIVTIVPWNYPEKLDRESWYHGQLIAIQDCLYRNMHNTEYLVFNDIDEFIVPHKHSSWSEMVEAMFKPRTQCAFQFHSAFFEKPKQNVREDTNLFTMVSTRRTSHLSQIRTKCMVRPYEIFEKGIHHVSKPIWATLDVTRMPEHVAFLHHYRACMRDFGMNCDTHEEDNILGKYKSSLEKSVASVLNVTRLNKNAL